MITVAPSRQGALGPLPSFRSERGHGPKHDLSMDVDHSLQSSWLNDTSGHSVCLHLTSVSAEVHRG